MATVTNASLNRDWIAEEFAKGIAAEEALSAEAQSRSDAPPDPSLSVLYQEIARADAKHRKIVEAIATRFGHTPNKAGGGITEAIARLKDKFASMGSSPIELLGHDLASKANAIHWYSAWVSTFKAVGETAFAAELEGILEEEISHRDALQQALNRLVERGARDQTVTNAT
jgi:rubrerythrin